MNTLPSDNALKGILLALQNDEKASALYDQLEAAGFIMCTITALNGRVCNFTFRGRTEIVGKGETVAEALADAKAKLEAYIHFETERERERERQREPELPPAPDVPPLEDTLPDPPARPTSEQYGLPF